MNIVDVNNQNVKACLGFEYKGYVVSCSTIFTPHEVVVFDGDKDEYRALSIPDAIRWIETQGL